MAENRRRGSAPDKDALAALGTAGPSRLRKAAASDVVTELAGQPAAAPAPAPAAAAVNRPRRIGRRRPPRRRPASTSWKRTPTGCAPRI